LVVRILAVAGAVAVGGIGTGWLAKLIVKGVSFRNPPAALVRISRVLGGLIFGLLIAAWVFNLGGTGGIGGSGGGWWPFGQPGGLGTSNASGPADSKTPAQPKVNPNAPILRIQMRGGSEAQKDQRFYTIDEEPPLTWPELEKALKERRQQEPSLVIGIVIGKKSVDEGNPAVEILKNWAKENKVAVKIEFES
jgi:hypothetical protein